MSGTVWTKFYWSDWSDDKKLKLCSLAAQGLWMRCLCIAAEADPIGYVTVNGRALGVTDISRLAGVTETECEPLLSELERNGVFSRARNGTIYCRRMVKDQKKAEIARKNGSKGGNPSLGNKKENPSWDNPADKGRDKTHKPEARSQKEGASKKAPSFGSGEHDEIWQAVRELILAETSEEFCRSYYDRSTLRDGRLRPATGFAVTKLAPLHCLAEAGIIVTLSTEEKAA
jgi:hypothetical protein